MAQSSQHGHRLQWADLKAQPAADALAPDHLVVFVLFAGDTVGGADRLALGAAIALQADERGGPDRYPVNIAFGRAFDDADGAGTAALVIYLGQGSLPADGAVGTGFQAVRATGAAAFAYAGETFGLGLVAAGQEYLLALGRQLKYLLGAGLGAASAALAFGEVNLGQTIFAQGNCPIGAGGYAVSETQTAVQTLAGAAKCQHSGPAGGNALMHKPVSYLGGISLADQERNFGWCPGTSFGPEFHQF